MVNGASEKQPSGWFSTTHWTVVQNAKEPDSQVANDALGKLFGTYWAPIHAYIRRTGYNTTDADDLTQQFCARFLEKQHYLLADPKRGRFRAFLLTAVKHFLVNERERVAAQKRGGGQTLISLDNQATEDGESQLELSDERNAERSYERSWALALLAAARSRIESEYASAGKAERFAHIEKFLPGDASDMTYADAAAQLGVAEGTIKSDVHRLKQRYREVVREEISHTVNSPAEIDDELRHLMLVLSRCQ